MTSIQQGLVIECASGYKIRAGRNMVSPNLVRESVDYNVITSARSV